mmetsp:Transcript_22879/g.36742  ORF Transcript_22879/g.36742 Transcript_22879/m.36742 type:complete len:289 (-) Transcript_22879:67-933(-)
MSRYLGYIFSIPFKLNLPFMLNITRSIILSRCFPLKQSITIDGKPLIETIKSNGHCNMHGLSRHILLEMHTFDIIENHSFLDLFQEYLIVMHKFCRQRRFLKQCVIRFITINIVIGRHHCIAAVSVAVVLFVGVIFPRLLNDLMRRETSSRWIPNIQIIQCGARTQVSIDQRNPCTIQLKINDAIVFGVECARHFIPRMIVFPWRYLPPSIEAILRLQSAFLMLRHVSTKQHVCRLERNKLSGMHGWMITKLDEIPFTRLSQPEYVIIRHWEMMTARAVKITIRNARD